MSSELEVERKFLVNTFPHHLTPIATKHIVQGYLGKNSGIRVRVVANQEVLNINDLSAAKVDKVILGVKQETNNPLVRLEEEKEFSAHFFTDFLEQCQNNIIFKTRSVFDINGNIWEVDVFHERHKGLITAEVEGESGTINNIDIPDFCQEEVTYDLSFRNEHISGQFLGPESLGHYIN